MFDFVGTTGNLERQADSTHTVTLWHIPNGADYDKAKVVTVFFSKLSEAFAFGKHWSMPPKMALVNTITDYDTTMSKLEAERYNRCPSFDHQDGWNDAMRGDPCDLNRSEAYQNGYNDFRREMIDINRIAISMENTHEHRTQ